jgi:hypothetical protein
VGHDNIPGGAEKVPVPAGPVAPVKQEPLPKRASARVAQAYVKKALYWAAVDRKYRATLEECETGNFRCPRCKDVFLRNASYKRENGSSVRLLGCPECLFLILPTDIENHPDNVDTNPAEG